MLTTIHFRAVVGFSLILSYGMAVVADVIQVSNGRQEIARRFEYETYLPRRRKCKFITHSPLLFTT